MSFDMTPVGIVALSYAKRANEPNPVNKRLARATDNANDELQQGGVATVVVAQWEISLALQELGAPAHFTVSLDAATQPARDGSLYLDSSDVLREAFAVFRELDITHVVVVANPFLHLAAVKAMVRKAGFTIIGYKVPWVGFDNSKENLQWWCKGPIRFITYLGLQVVGKLTKQNFHGIGEKRPPITT